MRRTEPKVLAALTGLAILLSGAAPAAPAEDDTIEAVSLLGRPLARPQLPEAFRAEQTALLAEARSAHEAAPDDPDLLIWVGRRTAYLGHYREAIEIYTAGLARHPQYAPLYRHRGHRYISVRRFEAAIADLERAAELVDGLPDEIEPDGLPNARGVPTSTLQSNIWYHLGLAHYLRGDFERALEAYRADLAVATNPDMLSATSYWLYMTLRRLGRDDEAGGVLEPISADLDIIENHEYHRLLLVFKGELSADQLLDEISADDDSLGSATTGYGLANWFLVSGDRDRAAALLRRIVDGSQWASFGYLAAEAELARWD